MFRFPWVPFIYRFDCIFILRFVFSLPPVVCRRAHVLRYLGLLAYSGVQHKLWCVFVLFVFVLCIVKSNTNWVVFFALFVFVLCLVYGGVQHILCCVFCFFGLRLVFCVWWCTTHIALRFLFCLSSSYVPNVASFSGLSILDCPFGFSNAYWKQMKILYITLKSISQYFSK